VFPSSGASNKCELSQTKQKGSKKPKKLKDKKNVCSPKMG
jgi:hypothetical protein